MTIRAGVMDRLEDIAPYLGIFGTRSNKQRVIKHLLALAEERPDFFHVANKNRKWPPLDVRYAQK